MSLVRDVQRCVLFGVVILSGLQLISSAPLAEVKDFKTVNETSLEEYLYQCLRSFINVMLTGNPQLGIPVLDPLESTRGADFVVSDSLVHADVNATDVESIGLSSFEITSVDVSLLQARCNVSLHFPRLEIRGSYLLDGSYNFFYPIYGDGPFIMYLYDVTSSGTATLSLVDSHLTMSSPLTMGQMYYSSLSAEFLNFAGLFISEENKRQIKVVVARELYINAEVRIREALATAIYEYLNAQLMDYNVTKYPNPQKHN